MENILELRNISYTYHTVSGETNALSNINLSVKKGEFLSIVGPSGCGKSTLLSLISGLISPTEGTIRFHGENIGYMLQKDHLFEWRTIYRNVTLGLEIQNKMQEPYIANVNKMLNNYGLEQFKKAHPSELSGGMRQRAALIRTLALNPDVLLLDEPFSALDYQTRLQVCDDIYQIIRQEHKTAILITHDLSEAISIGGRVVILTPRPGTIQSIIDASFPPEFDSPIKARTAPEFKSYFNLIWKELKSHE